MTSPFPLPIPHTARTSPLDFIPNLPDTIGDGERMWRVLSRMKITQGKLAGKTLGEVAPPWQQKMIKTIYGFTDDQGIRRFDELFLYVAKKAGKSSLTGMLLVAHALTFPEPRGLCIVLASTKEQASIVYDSMASTIEADGYLLKQFLIRRYKSDIIHKATNTVLKAVSCELSSTVGQIPSFYVVDELHLIGMIQKGAALVRQLSSGAAVRPNPMGIYITTAPVGKSAGIFNSTYNRAKRIQAGKSQNDRMLPILFEMPDDDDFDVENPKNWWMSNPSVGTTFTQEWLEREFEIAKSDPDPSALMNFYSQHLNIHAEDKFGVTNWIPTEVWDKFADVSVSLENIIQLSEIIYVSVDLGYRDDPSAIAVMGERTIDDEVYYTIWSQQYLHKDGYNKRREHVPYDDFIASGELLVSERDNNDMVEMTKIVFELKDTGRLAAVGVDPMGLIEFAATLEAKKIEVIGIKQGYQMNPSLISFERNLYGGKIVHGGKPMLRWNIGNGQLQERGQAMALTKPSDMKGGSQKIDGLVCCVMCMALADDPEIKPKNLDIAGMIG